MDSKGKLRIPSLLLAGALLATLAAGCASSSSDGGYGPARSTSPQEEASASFGMVTSDYAEYMQMERGEYDEYDSVAVAEEAAEAPEVALSTSVTGEVVPNTRKIIQTYSLSLQTLEFDAAVTAIEQSATALGGYVESSSVDGKDLYSEYGRRRAQFTIRVPVDQLEGYVADLGTHYNLTSKVKSSEDVTERYFDLEARLNSLRIQQERLTAMLESSTELEYLLEVERELASVLYQIESITSSLRRLENSVSLSTVHILLEETYEFTPPENIPVTFGQRINSTAAAAWQDFVSGIQNFILGLIRVLPALIVLGVLGLVVFLIVRKVLRSQEQKRREHPQQQQTPPPYLQGPYGQAGPDQTPAQQPKEPEASQEEE